MEVKFFPRNDVPVDICNIRYDAKAAIIQCTDTLTKSRAYFAEMLGFKYNVKPTAFVSPLDGDLDDYSKKDIVSSGFMGMGLYFPTDRWKNPTTGAIEVIPDYSATAYTAAGVAAYGVTLGAAKVTRYPNHGQQMYDVSGGALGFDLVNGVSGASNQSEFTGLVDFLKLWGVDVLSLILTSISYRNGLNPSKQVYVPHFLAGRNSTANSRTAFGISKIDGAYLGSPDVATSRLDRISQSVASRWNDTKATDGEATATSILQATINDSLDKFGVFVDFTHHHTATIEELETLYSLISDAIGTNDVWRCSYSEAFSYFWFRELVKRAVATVYNGEVYITIEWDDTYKDTFASGIPQGFDYSQISTPLSVKINLTGTPLEGVNIQNSGGDVISKGSNVFVVDLPFGNLIDGMKGVKISEAPSADYQQNTRPTISTSVTGTTLTVTTDQNTKAVLYRKASTDTDDKYISDSRQNLSATVHVFDLIPDQIYKVGVFTERQANLSGEITL